MPLDLTDTQSANLNLASSRPIHIVRFGHSGADELLSCSGNVTFDSELYTAGGISVSNVQDGQSATLTMPATSTRIAEVQNGSWRNGNCEIYVIPATPSDSGSYAVEEAILVLDGIITSSSFSGGSITIAAKQRNLDGNYTPRNTLSEVCNHIPPPGSVLTWQNGSITLESRR